MNSTSTFARTDPRPSDDDGGDFAPPTPPPSPPKPSAKDATVAALEQLVGTNISVRVTDVNDKARRVAVLCFSILRPPPCDSSTGRSIARVSFRLTDERRPIFRPTFHHSQKIVVSERALVQDVGAKALKPGDVARGAVMSMSDFGAFVEILPDDARCVLSHTGPHTTASAW